MENYIDAKRFLEDSFSIGRSIGPFLVPFTKGEPLDDITRRVAGRAKDVWPWRLPNLSYPVYIRIFTWEKTKPKVNDNMPVMSEFERAVVSGLVQGRMVNSAKQVGGLWVMREYYSELDTDMISIQVVWGIA